MIGFNGVGDVSLAKRLVLIVIVLLGISAVGLVGYNEYFGSGRTEPRDILGGNSRNNLIDPSDEGLQNRVSILLVGTDQRPDQITYSTDTIILASVDPETKRISLLSIPRDTRIALPKHGYVKINDVVTRTDLETLQKTVEELTGEDIKGYIKTNFQGFKKTIDTLGGITVDVEKAMYYETGDIEDGYINLRKGVQRLDGDKALQYARFRHDALADISRTARQQIVLKAVAKEMFQLSTIPKLPLLIPQLLNGVQTNLSSKDIFVLAKVAVRFDKSNMVSQTLPGSFLDIDEVSYWKVDPIEVKKVVSNLFQGKTTDKVIDQQNVDLLKPITPTPSKPLPKVPGNSQDPNGQKSPGHLPFPVQEFEIQVQNDIDLSE